MATKPDKVQARLLEYASRPTPTEFKKGRVGVLVKTLNDYLGGDTGRRLCLGWLFGKYSINDLTPQALNGLWKWIGFHKIDES